MIKGRDQLIIGGSDSILIGKTVSDPEATLQLLRDGVSIADLYILFINRSNNALMELMLSTRISKERFADKTTEVIAIANGRQEALSMITAIIADHLDSIDDARMFKSGISASRGRYSRPYLPKDQTRDPAAQT